MERILVEMEVRFGSPWWLFSMLLYRIDTLDDTNDGLPTSPCTSEAVLAPPKQVSAQYQHTWQDAI